ncbi:amylo-alpha-1,6-glucosidase [Micromonospora sp. ATCC 39149]|nr:amylo-alpha-1,6-glucosidase [Micromonospora sp. ATCC 39149]
MLFRGVVSVEGDLPLFLVFRRLLPIRADSAGSAGSVAAEPTAETLPGGGHDGIGLHDTTGIFYGNMFMISNRNGDVETEPATPLGLFFLDTRFLSTWRLSLDGEKLTELSIEDVRSFESRFALVPGQPTYYVQATTSILRHRSVGETFEEAVTLINYAAEPVRYALRLDVGADFAEVQEIRDGLRRAREVSTTVDDSALRLHYRRRTLHRETVVSASEPAHVDERGFTFTVSVDSHSTWTVRLRVLTLVRDLSRRDLRERLHSSTHRSRAEAGREIDGIAAAVPELRADHGPLSEAYRRSVLDLAALYYQGLNYRDRLPATGLPWSMTLLGRESLVSSLQVLPFLPHRAVSTLRILALSQGARIDPFRGEQPGRIVQESRYGESAAFADTPDAADYSAADTTPLFVILLDEYERWTGDAELVRRYEFEARAAIAWLDEYADPVGDGYVWSTRRQRPGGRSTRAGATRWRASASATAGSPPSPRRSASSRGTPTTPGYGRPGWPGCSGTTRPTPTGSNGPPPRCGTGSTGTSGCRSGATTRWHCSPTVSGSTRWRPTSGTCCGAASSSPNTPSAWRATCSGRPCSPAGECGPWPAPRGSTTRWATTPARSGRRTTLSSSGACAGTASGRRPPGSRGRCWRRGSTSRARCRRTSPATTGPPPASPCRTTPQTARTPPRPGHPCCCYVPCSASNPATTIW